MINYRYQVVVTTRGSDGNEIQTTERDLRTFDKALRGANAERAAWQLFPESFVRVEIYDVMARRGRPQTWELDAYGNPKVVSHRDLN